MTVLASVLFFLAFVYAGVMGAYAYGWRAMPSFRVKSNRNIQTTVAVLVPARNEAGNIMACLQSILNGSYPHKLLKIIVIDDFSEDETPALVAACPDERVQLLRLSEYFPEASRFQPNKKAGIELAVSRSDADIILTTDADCIVPVDWVSTLVQYLEAHPGLDIVTGPVLSSGTGGLLQAFQCLDLLGMAGITGAGYRLRWHRMGNGANLAYRKAAFEATGGYSGNRQIASGDDMFLLQKMEALKPGSTGFVKTPYAVLTSPQPDWPSLWQQRLRWGTKNAAMPEWRIKAVLLVVLLFCWAIWLALAGLLDWRTAMVLLTIKAFCDYFFLRTLAAFFGQNALLRRFLPAFLIHTAYIAAAGAGSLIRSGYTWKGRAVPALTSSP